MHYKETTFPLEERAPDVFAKFMEGFIVVKDREGFFNPGALNMGMEYPTPMWSYTLHSVPTMAGCRDPG